MERAFDFIEGPDGKKHAKIRPIEDKPSSVPEAPAFLDADHEAALQVTSNEVETTREQHIHEVANAVYYTIERFLVSTYIAKTIEPALTYEPSEFPEIDKLIEGANNNSFGPGGLPTEPEAMIARLEELDKQRLESTINLLGIAGIEAPGIEPTAENYEAWEALTTRIREADEHMAMVQRIEATISKLYPEEKA